MPNKLQQCSLLYTLYITIAHLYNHLNEAPIWTYHSTSVLFAIPINRYLSSRRIMLVPNLWVGFVKLWPNGKK
jgi:hypothetical protein